MFRALGKSKIAFVLAILFGISLFFFKGGSRYSNLLNSDNIIATVSGTPISTTKFNRTMQLNINQFNQMLGKKLSGEEIRAFQIHSLALGKLVNDAVFEDEFNKNNYLIDETIIAKKTKERVPMLYDKNDKLDEEVLNRFLNQQGLKIEDLVNIIDYESKAEIFDNLLFVINLPEKISSKINSHKSHKRKIEFIKLSLDKVKLSNIQESNINKSNPNIKNFYDENINNYMTKENRNISYIIIDKLNYKNQFQPNETDINNYYNENKNLYIEPEKRDFIQFNFKSKKDAQKFLENVKNFNKIDIINYANKNNIAYNNFDELSRNDVLEVLSNNIFNLNINEISNIIETPIANHIIFLKNIKPKKQLKLEDVYIDISSTLLNVELENYFSDLKNNINQNIINGYSLSEISTEYDLEVKLLNNKENINNSNNETSIEKAIIKEGYILNKDFVSNLIDFNKDISFVLNVDKINKSEPIEYDKIYKTVINDWISNKKKEHINNNYNENVNNFDYLNKLSSEYSIKLETLDIDQYNNKLVSNLNKIIFTKKLNDHFLFIENNEIYIGRVNKIMMNEDYTSDIEVKLTSDLKNAFGSEIMKNKKISTNDSLLNALLNQY